MYALENINIYIYIYVEVYLIDDFSCDYMVARSPAYLLVNTHFYQSCLIYFAAHITFGYNTLDIYQSCHNSLPRYHLSNRSVGEWNGLAPKWMALKRATDARALVQFSPASRRVHERNSLWCRLGGSSISSKHSNENFEG